MNKIQAGTLGIELQYEESEGVWKTVTDDTVLAFKKAAAREAKSACLLDNKSIFCHTKRQI